MRCLQVSARLIFALWLALAPVKAWAGSMLLLGAGSVGGAAPTYQGVGDVFSTNALGFWSCSRVWNAASASTATNLCDLNAVTGGAAVCTLRGSASGFVDQTAYCPGSLTPSAACAAASGGGCVVSKAYNQVSPGTNDMTQATLAQMPPVIFASTPTGNLPAISCGTGGSAFNLATGTTTVNQPYTLSLVYVRTNGAASYAFGAASGGIGIGGNSGAANQAAVAFNTNSTITGATDSTWHTLSGLGSGASSASNLDGTDAAQAGAGSTNLTAVAIRLCRPNAAQFVGTMAEAVLWGGTSTSTTRNSVSSNQHGTNGYNF